MITHNHNFFRVENQPPCEP